MNKDRGIKKWLPFASLIEQKESINDLLKEKQKIPKPLLSLEQQKEIEDKIIEAYYEQIPATFTIYKNGLFLTVTSFVLDIDTIYKKIILTNHTILLFNQILKVII